MPSLGAMMAFKPELGSYATPDDVVGADGLTYEQKLRVLQEWRNKAGAADDPDDPKKAEGRSALQKVEAALQALQGLAENRVETPDGAPRKHGYGVAR